MISLLVFSCNEPAPSKDTIVESKAEKNCDYAVEAENLKFEWTAFKTTEKIAVKGTFDEIKAVNENQASSIPVVLTNTKFEINLNSINSNNVERDEKLREFVFGKMTNSEKFEGTIEACDGDNTKGVLIVNLTMNGVSKQLKMNYYIAESESKTKLINISGALDLLNWKAEKSVEAINQACLKLHAGADGVSKTWSTMEINVIVPLKITCK